jgi:hypothetical protein
MLPRRYSAGNLTDSSDDRSIEAVEHEQVCVRAGVVRGPDEESDDARNNRSDESARAASERGNGRSCEKLPTASRNGTDEIRRKRPDRNEDDG